MKSWRLEFQQDKCQIWLPGLSVNLTRTLKRGECRVVKVKTDIRVSDVKSDEEIVEIRVADVKFDFRVVKVKIRIFLHLLLCKKISDRQISLYLSGGKIHLRYPVLKLYDNYPAFNFHLSYPYFEILIFAG